MSVQSYLARVAGTLIIRDAEKRRIDKSVETLSRRIASHFGNDVVDHFAFGSYTRGTILPRRADERSDVDYIVIFNTSLPYKPQTFLNQLGRFVSHEYSTSEVYQSHPTIVLELHHIKFELVPAKRNWLKTISIPSPANGYVNWMATDPNGFNSRLTSKNRSNGNTIKPLVRLMKYWNATNGYIYSSYELENSIVGKNYWFSESLKDYFVATVNNMSYGWFSPQSAKDKIDRAKRLVRNAVNYERLGRINEAETEIRKLLPEIQSGEKYR